MATPRPMNIRWLDANHKALRVPIYLGKIKPGMTERAYIYMENLDHRTEDIVVHVEPEWIRVISAPSILNTGQVGKVILELKPPYDLKDPPVLRVFGTGNAVRVI